MEWTLDQLPLRQEAVVLQMEEGGQFGRRMKEMGITEGVHICRKRQAPLGDPSVYMVRGSAFGNPQYRCGAYPCPPGAYICYGRLYKPPREPS